MNSEPRGTSTESPAMWKGLVRPEGRSRLGDLLRRALQFGFRRECPCCHARLRKFLPFGQPPRKNAQCPICRALERHRLILLYLTSKTDFFDGRPKKMLHVAPEKQLAQIFQAVPGIDYLSGDLNNPRAMVKMDITDIQFPDESFDIVYCSHVLEHVPEDRQAMREFYRVLKPDGWAILQVPITADTTFEDPSITDPAERERVFGQYDHVRRYGPDYKDRLIEAGFTVDVDPFTKEMSEAEVTRYGVRSESIYRCTKGT